METRAKKILNYDRFLLKYAYWIDNLDMYLGPLTDAAELSSSEFMNSVAIASNIFQFGILKGPFVAMYLLRTKDYRALWNWVPREIIALGVPLGGTIEIMRNYEKITLRHYGLGSIKEIMNP